MEMIIKNRKILLTVFNRGRLGTPVSNSSDKSIKTKILRSPFENHIINSKGVPTGKYNTPKNHFKAPNDFKERKETICSCKTTLSEQVTNYFISSIGKFIPFHPSRAHDNSNALKPFVNKINKACLPSVVPAVQSYTT